MNLMSPWSVTDSDTAWIPFGQTICDPLPQILLWQVQLWHDVFAVLNAARLSTDFELPFASVTLHLDVFFLFKISLGISLILSRLYHCHQWSDLKLLPVDQKDIYVKCCPKERYRATLAHFRHFPPLSFIFVLYSTLHRFSYDKYHLYSEEQWWSQTPCCGCVSQWQDTQYSSSWVKDERSQMQSVTGLKVELTQI